ncbi:unnamed protein product [Camellia sinensis]
MAQAFLMMMMMIMMMIATSSINFAEAFKEEGGMGGVIHVGGKVLCQDCSQGWNEWVHGAKPIKVRLVSSPDPVCNITTDFAGGRSGVKLRRPTVVYRDYIKHVLSPFYYTTPM